MNLPNRKHSIWIDLRGFPDGTTAKQVAEYMGVIPESDISCIDGRVVVAVTETTVREWLICQINPVPYKGATLTAHQHRGNEETNEKAAFNAQKLDRIAEWKKRSAEK
jgi:hypothetical protein